MNKKGTKRYISPIFPEAPGPVDEFVPNLI